MSKKKIPEKPKPSSAGIYQPTSSSYVGSLKRRINDTKQSTLGMLMLLKLVYLSYILLHFLHSFL